MSDGTRLRDEFLLDPSVTFLNHGSFGTTPRAVFERYQEWQLELERQAVLFLVQKRSSMQSGPESGPRTRALFLRHHTSTTAMTLPVEELCRRSRQPGIQTIVDGAHVAGHLPLNLRELDVDDYAADCHEWQ